MAKFHNLGSMIAKKDKQTGEAILDKNDKPTYYVKLDKNVKLVVNGEEVTSGYINVSRPRDKYDKKLEKGQITKAEHAQAIARFEKGGDLNYINFEFTAVTGDDK